ncbi:DUF262 domain-containing protein [Oceaniglobus trochenteri]|uniref:DUF262 domain-containing protein n=1 Tax=Oceaniglobus trochenteri TaxID=2763260 RepID=UPI003CC9C4D5
MNDRKMPTPYRLGQHMASAVSHAELNWQNAQFAHLPDRQVMGFRLPSWQRPLVWTEAQMVRLIESLWLGIPIGTYSYVLNDDPATDGLLIDGQPAWPRPVRPAPGIRGGPFRSAWPRFGNRP